MKENIRTLIVDDEKSSRRAVAIQLEEMEGVEVVGEADGGAAAVRLITEKAPDLVFLDVQMPDVDGFDVLEQLGPDNLPHIVFVTAHDEFALRAFEVNAVDYLLKPVDDRKLERSLARVRRQKERSEEETSTAKVFQLMEHLGPGAGDRLYKTRLLVKEKGEYFFVPVEEIESIEADGNYARLHADAGTHLIRSSLSDLEAGLDPSVFLRIHRGAIVNLDRVTTIQPHGVSDYRVVLRSERTLNVGRTYRDTLLQRQD